MNIRSASSVASISNSIKHRHTIWLIALVVCVFLIWAKFAALDEIVRGPGKVIPSSKTQVIQNLEGGILAELNVREGDEVSKGEVIARLSDTKFKGAHGELEKELHSLQIKLSRLASEINKTDTFTPAKTNRTAVPAIAKSELQLFNARMQEYKTKKRSFSASFDLHDREVKLLTRLSRKGVVPELDVIKASQRANEAKKNIDTLESEYFLVRSKEYAETLAELTQLEQSLSIRTDQLVRTTLSSPVRAIVNKVLVSTIGGVIAPGEEILELVPLDDELKIEAKINPKDIAFVHPGMRTTIKFSAYDYTIYGSFRGAVHHISADTFEDENTRDAQPYYKVEIAVDPDALAESTNEIVIRPGMLAEAELHVGQKTVLDYLLKPLFKASEAFREP